MKLKAGIIGCGNIGGKYDEGAGRSKAIFTHAGMFSSNHKFALVSASDVNPKRLKEFGHFWNVENLYLNARSMLEKEELDIVSIATPDKNHEKSIREVLRLGGPRVVFTEKPLASDEVIASKLLDECAKKKITLVVDYVRRWDENHLWLRRFLLGGKLGKIHSATGYYVRGIRHNGCQLINLMQFFFGSIRRVQSIGGARSGSIAEDPSLNLHMVTEGGVELNVIALDRKSYNFSIFELEIFGEGGRISLLQNGDRILLHKTERDSNFKNFKRLSSPILLRRKSTYPSAIRNAGVELASLISSPYRGPHESALAAVRDLRVVSAALLSAKRNNSVVRL